MSFHFVTMAEQPNQDLIVDVIP